MEFIVKIFYWAIFVWLGFLMLKYRRVVKSWTWNFVWAERYLWNWWTNLVLVLLALALMFFGAMYPFWFEIFPADAPTPTI
jgi:hypothetical protein